MQINLNTIRILKFACSFACSAACLVLDIFLASDKYFYSPDNVITYFICTDVLGVLSNGYYLITIRNKWNKAPVISDHSAYCIEFILWLIYVIVKSIKTAINITKVVYLVSIAFGGINILLCILYAIVLSLSAGRLYIINDSSSDAGSEKDVQIT